MKRWIDVDPSKWFYRAVLESDRIKESRQSQGGIINSNTYNAFEADYPRLVFTFTSKENQMEFDCPGYKVKQGNLVSVYISGVFTTPSSVEDDKVFISNPIASGMEVIIIISGIPKTDTRGEGDCATYNTVGCSNYVNPNASLEEKANYVYDVNYPLNEYVYVLGKSLKRVQVDKLPGESAAKAVYRVMGPLKDSFTIVDGEVFVSMEYNDIPISVNYNYRNDKGQIVNRQSEKVIPKSACPVYNDRFNPSHTMLRYEFYTIISRLRMNLYRRFTDIDFTNTNPMLLTRNVKDIGDFIGTWYEEPVMNILDEKFLDGCYVMPLYQDNSFKPNECITRAEMVVAISRFMEWALEKFK